jgi:hypothetical protein
VGKIGSVYKQPEKEEDDSCHSWRVPSKWKGVQKGVKGRRQGEQGEIGRRVKETTPCIYVTITCVQRIIER